MLFRHISRNTFYNNGTFSKKIICDRTDQARLIAVEDVLAHVFEKLKASIQVILSSSVVEKKNLIWWNGS